MHHAKEMLRTCVHCYCIQANPLTSDGTDTTGVMALANSLMSNDSLTALNLWRCGLDSQTGHQLAAGLEVI
jgi:hypothetical protein